MHPLGSVSVGVFMAGFFVILTKLKAGGAVFSMLPKGGQLLIAPPTPSFAIGLFLSSCKNGGVAIIKEFFRGLK